MLPQSPEAKELGNLLISFRYLSSLHDILAKSFWPNLCLNISGPGGLTVSRLYVPERDIQAPVQFVTLCEERGSRAVCHAT